MRVVSSLAQQDKDFGSIFFLEEKNGLRGFFFGNNRLSEIQGIFFPKTRKTNWGTVGTNVAPILPVPTITISISLEIEIVIVDTGTPKREYPRPYPDRGGILGIFLVGIFVSFPRPDSYNFHPRHYLFH